MFSVKSPFFSPFRMRADSCERLSLEPGDGGLELAVDEAREAGYDLGKKMNI